WPGADVAAAPRDPLRLVPGDPDPGAGQRRAARRRDRLACPGQDPLAVVLHDDRFDLLHDRPEPGVSGAEEVLQGGVRRGGGDRLLGRLQRGRLRQEAEMPAALAARYQADPALPQARGGLAGALQAGEAPDPRRAAAEQAASGPVRGAVHVAARAIGGSPARVAGTAVGGAACAAAGEAPAAARLRTVHVPGPSRGPVRQQSWRAPDPSGRARAKEQLRQRQRRWGRDASGVDERLPHAQATWSQPRLDNHKGRPHLPPNRETTTATRADY